MTRREGLLAILLMFLLTTAGLTWQFGGWGLIAAGAAGAAVVLLFFQRVEEVVTRGDPVPDTVQELLEAFERDRS